HQSRRHRWPRARSHSGGRAGVKRASAERWLSTEATKLRAIRRPENRDRAGSLSHRGGTLRDEIGARFIAVSRPISFDDRGIQRVAHVVASWVCGCRSHEDESDRPCTGQTPSRAFLLTPMVAASNNGHLWGVCSKLDLRQREA